MLDSNDEWYEVNVNNTIEIKVSTIEAALKAGLGTEVEIIGKVIKIDQDWNEAYGNMSVFLTDGTGTIIAFRITEKVEVGYVIKVVGTIAVFNGVNQIAQGSTVTIISTED